jgi:hypothetical protein
VIGTGAAAVAAVAALATVVYARRTVGEARRALDTEIRLRRLTQFDRIGDLLVQVIEEARREAHAGRSPYRTLPALLTRLEAAQAVLTSLGGPEVPIARRLAEEGAGLDQPQLVDHAVRALQEAEILARTRAELKLDP